MGRAADVLNASIVSHSIQDGSRTGIDVAVGMFILPFICTYLVYNAVQYCNV